MAADFPETEVILNANEDQTEVTVVFKSTTKLSTEAVCIELESLAHDLSKADLQRRQPGVSTH